MEKKINLVEKSGIFRVVHDEKVYYLVVQGHSPFLRVSRGFDEKFEDLDFVEFKRISEDVEFSLIEEMVGSPLKSENKVILPDVDPKKIDDEELFDLDQMEFCFEESRLTHGMIGFKHKDFEEFKKTYLEK